MNAQELSAQEIMDAFLPLLPRDWRKFVLHAKVTEGFYDMTFYVSDGASRWTQCFTLKKQGCFSTEELRYAFDRVYDTCRRMQNACDRFEAFTMVVCRNGQFHIDFSYITDGMPIDYAWKNKYLT